MEISKTCNSKEFEDKWYKHWIDNNCFKSVPNDSEPFTIVIPPPNNTNNIHIGHALNNTYQDIMIRFKKMQGYNTCWVPGTDSGGIATQNMVEKDMIKNKINKTKLKDEEFLELIKNWNDEKRDIIVNQLQKIGCACDWSRERFTMDEDMNNSVQETFKKLYDENMIYQGNYMVDWCPHCQTAISNDEVEYKENKGKLYYIKYEIVNKDVSDIKSHITIATTRPETLLGDVAVAYSPKDSRYSNFANESFDVIVPIVNRKIPLIKDDYVKPDFGTGLVKITPLHDKNDYEIGAKHKLQGLKVIEKNGPMTSLHPPYSGMDRFECREKIVKDLHDLGLIERIEDYDNTLGECYRCHTVIESYLSNQWFIKMKKFRELAKNALVDNNINLIPEYHKKIYHNWLNSDIDWCISRQIKWGHKIPVWYCSCGQIICELEKPDLCFECGNPQLYKENSVLDTWFASSLWAHAVFTKKEQQYYLPTSILITGSDILFFWVMRMIMMSKYTTNKKPFDNVFLHGVVRDKEGRKMSKSLGNGIDPLDVINKYSADVLRFTLVFYTPYGEDANISLESFEFGKKFCTKLWNSVRFILMNMKTSQSTVVSNERSDIDKWIINKLNIVTEQSKILLNKCKFAEYTVLLNNFLRNDFCDIYLEYCKPYLYSKDNNTATHETLLLVINNLLKMLHPVIPFITAELYHCLLTSTNNCAEKNIIHNIFDESYPENIDIGEYAPSMDIGLDVHRALIKQILNVRNEFRLKKNKISIILQNDDQSPVVMDYLKNNQEPIQKLAYVEDITFLKKNGSQNDKLSDLKTLKYALPFGKITLYVVANDHFNVESKIKYLETRKNMLNKKINKLTKFINNKKTGEKKKQKFSLELSKANRHLSETEESIRYYLSSFL